MNENIIDEDGNEWKEFDVADYNAGNSLRCECCGEPMNTGWVNLDGGEEVCGSYCREHVFDVR